MRRYKVSFFKTLLSSDGHRFRCPQQVITVESDNRDEAVELAKHKFEGDSRICDWHLHADEIDADECARSGAGRA
jgi:hypothetical protein